jgi:hypothetical protein
MKPAQKTMRFDLIAPIARSKERKKFAKKGKAKKI